VIAALLGASAMAAFGIALFFLRFWLQTRDPFHLLFAIAFGLLALQRFMLVAVPEHPNEASPALYVPRLAAYVLIIIAVGTKNFGHGVRPPRPPP
jgi:ABC-type Fe3+-siderophore transport system permease subunit